MISIGATLTKRSRIMLRCPKKVSFMDLSFFWNGSLTNIRGYDSVVKSKLDYFMSTGEIMKYTPEQYRKKASRSRDRLSLNERYGRYSLQKALLLLKSKYPSSLVAEDGSVVHTDSLVPQDLKVDSQKSFQILKSLLYSKKVKKHPLDKRLLLWLLGTNAAQLHDPYLVTHDTLKLLYRDNDSTRADCLVRLAGPRYGVTAMNAILKWHLDRQDVKGGLKSFNDRKKWGIPLNNYTYTILFDGLLKVHEFGTVSDSLAENSVEIFRNFYENFSEEEDALIRGPCSNIQFNACLSILVKNFKNEQEYAWSFFDLLLPDPHSERPSLFPNCQTFTILLHGIKKYYESQYELLSKDQSQSRHSKLIKFFVLQSRLVQTSRLILDKVMKQAIPPVPPSKEDADKNPELLLEYRKNARRHLIDIDPVFASVFVSCFINNKASTGADFSSGSHYLYVQEGLQYLRMWCPDVESILRHISSDSVCNCALGPSKLVKQNTDLRIQTLTHDLPEEAKLLTDNKLLPQDVVAPESLTLCKVNPLVIFPPPPSSSRKTKAIFSGKQKRLVDFSRPTFTEVSLYMKNKQYHRSKGKFGQKLPKFFEDTIFQKKTINKFLLMLLFDSLVLLGKLEEFYLASWYCLTKWGGIYVTGVDIEKEIKEKGLAFDIFSQGSFRKTLFEDHLDLHTSSDSTTQAFSISYEEKLKLTPQQIPEIIDILFVENIIYKIKQNVKKHSPSKLCTDIFSVLVSPATNVRRGLTPRQETIDSIFSVFMKELYHYNDSNYNRILLEKRKKNQPNNTPKRPITSDQLKVILTNFERFMSAVLYFNKRHGAQFNLKGEYIESFNRFVERIYDSTWIDCNKDETLEFHKLITKSGVLFFGSYKFPGSKSSVQDTCRMLPSIEVVRESILKQPKDKPSNFQEDNLAYALDSILHCYRNGEKVLNDQQNDAARHIYSSI